MKAASRYCCVPGCERFASPSHPRCAWHRRHLDAIARPPELERPKDLVETGMVVDDAAGVLELVGGFRLNAPSTLSLHYFFGGYIGRSTRMPLLLPAPRLRHFLDRLRPHVCRGGAQ